MRVPLAVFVMVGLLSMMAGCPKPKEPGGTGPLPGSSGETAKIEAQETPAPGTFAWTEVPTVAMIPAGPLKGVLNGKPFEAKTVLISTNIEGTLCKITVSDRELSSDTDLLIDDTGFDIELPNEVKAGESFTKAMAAESDGRAFYHYGQSNGKGPVSVPVPWSAAVVIDEGDPGTYNQKGETMQVTGTFKGRLAVCFDDQDPDSEHPLSEASYVAGTFDAKVRYWDAPPDAADPSAAKSGSSQ